MYLAFDVVPAPKGAATHISAFAQALGARGPIDLVTVAGPDSQQGEVERWPGVFQHALPAPGAHLIARVLGFRAQLGAWWGQRRVPVAHVRSIYEGFPLARAKGRAVEQLIFEVNGLPSIELKYHYPAVAEDEELLAKLRAQERVCLDAADRIVTPSAVTASHLVQCGADPSRIRVIPNGGDLARFPHRPPQRAPGEPLKLLYAGTFTGWQGVPLAIEALALLRRDVPATLTLVGPARARQKRDLLTRAQELGVAEFVELRDPVAVEALAFLHHAHHAVLAPLLPCDRNLVQGASPLKLLEAMAAGTPVVASDLPLTRELATDGETALLVKPGSAKALKDALLRLDADPLLGLRLSHAARAHVAAHFTWEHAQRGLLAVYDELEPSRSSTRLSAAAS